MRRGAHLVHWTGEPPRRPDSRDPSRRPTRADPSYRLRELGVLVLVYVGYAASRVLADDSFAPAVGRAVRILDLERALGLDVEAGLNRWFLEHDALGVAASFYYAGAHYLLTLAVVVWLFCSHRAAYGPARLALVGSTGVALLAYLAMPTAPPRLMEGWTDLLAVHSAAGWWGGEASAPQGLGWLTNQLAAFPSMHAGWALWVALAVGHVSAGAGSRRSPGRTRSSRGSSSWVPATTGCSTSSPGGPSCSSRGTGRPARVGRERRHRPRPPVTVRGADSRRRRRSGTGAGRRTRGHDRPPPPGGSRAGPLTALSPRRAARAPCGPARGRWWSTSAAARP